MNVSNARQKSTTEGSATGRAQRRVRPSRARGLRTRTGCLTCRERRVKCDDGKPTCLRCSKSDRVCRYAPSSRQNLQQNCAQEVDQSTVTEIVTGDELNVVQSNPRESGCEGVCAWVNGADPSSARNSLSSPQTQRANVGAPPYLQVTSSALVEHGRTQPSDLIEALPGDCSNEPNEQSMPSFHPALSNSPLSLSQASLLNTSPFEWYDLLARDAIHHIQRQSETSTSETRWKFPEIALSRRQSPAPECPDAQPGHVWRHREQHRLSREIPNQHTESRLPDHCQLSRIWNTASRIELSATDLKFFRYYTEVVAPILDLFDTGKHFSNVVPHLALQNTGLLKSILAVGAKHMSLATSAAPEDKASGGDTAPDDNSPLSHTAAGFSSEPEITPRSMATQYYYETLQYLSQTLLYPSYADSHEILATASMISTYEMFDTDSAPNSGVWEQHLRGSFWIQRSQDNDGESVDGLRQAVWWAWLRQDIWAAFQAGRPTITIWSARKPLEALNSDELATRIVYICGKCVKYASGATLSDQDPRERINNGDRLLHTLDEWYRVLPSSYQPVAITKDQKFTAMFPSIWIHPPNHAGAMQMYHFARAIVLLNQPTLGGLNAYMQREKELTESVKMVCGIANSCQSHEPAKAFVNVQALFGVGQFVRSPEVRDELLRILNEMLKISKFPAREVVARLKKVWLE
ncbi:hypothetical protein N7541_004247 [Penicillium brevicompactum]|uniref:Zn(2)-C6 fungal-type domain-containing protein n=1 Tax=Penicillium brevicompactum TaxID=5074 RepID=A0A9W9RT99_PENBR|nr:hypothetical protein N7541_004247 [Penicillium brevicompactum]